MPSCLQILRAVGGLISRWRGTVERLSGRGVLPELVPGGPSVDRAWSVCQTDAIRTTLDIDDDLMRMLLDRLPGRSKTNAIEHAIEAFLADDTLDRLKRLAGTMEIEDLSLDLRAFDRTT